MIQPGEELQIECSPEYMISSDKRVACISGDVYTTGSVHTLGTLPKCAPMPCEKPVVENGVIETAGPIKPGDKVAVTCGADYQITGPGYLVCTSATEFKYWNQTLCKAKECGVRVAPEIAHGRLSSPTLSPGQVVSIQCDLGYKPDCHVPITCISADNFQPIKLPQCLPQQCKKPVIRAGIVTGPTPLIPNNTLIVQCETGHTLTSVVPITCVTLEKYDPPLLPHCAPVSNCTVPHISNGGYIGKPPSMISPGATLRYACNNKGSYVPLFVPVVTCLTGQYFHPSPPICVAEDQVQSARLNYNRATISIRDFEKVEITTPTEASNPPSKVVGVLVAVIVIIALVVVLLVLLFRNKEYKQKLMKLFGGSTYLNKYRPVKAVRKDAEQGTKPGPPTTKKKTPPAKPPPPKLPPSVPPTQPGPYKPSLTNTPSRPAKSGAKSGGSKSQTPKKPTLYPHLSETSSEVLTQTKNNTDAELPTYPVYKPKPSKPSKPGKTGKADKPTMKPVAVSDLRQGGKRNGRSAFTAPRSTFTPTPSSLTRPVTETSFSTDSVSNIDSMDSESYEQLLNDMGLSKEDFKARIPRSRYMPEDYL
ncbi:uncharacterized protein LOC134815410 [Bolinopsis microptera]|uniref:uncharacterized protein LOC134815410 n=1 Tax=Bolinopsis microptera TaxID=2820187 RepID=UPI00307B073B